MTNALDLAKLAPAPRPPLDAVRAALANADVRRRIEGIVRQRVRPDDVGDVVHQVMCDALEAPAAPDQPADVPRWLFGIARHKVADHHRARQRARTEPLDVTCVPGASAPLEARSLLREVIADAARDPRGAQAMRWLAREAEGERLDEMAREVSLPPATVRQRVSRLRRRLQKRWLREAVLVAVASLLLALLYVQGQRPATAPIVADPLDNPVAAASAAVQGRWHVVSVEPDPALDPARRALVEADARTLTVQVQGGRVRLSSAAHQAERTLEVGPVEDGRFEARVLDGGRVQIATATFDRAGQLVVVSDGDWKGRIVLAR